MFDARIDYAKSLGCPPAFIECVGGNFLDTIFPHCSPGALVPVVPALLPFWGNLDDSVGLWYHPFCGRALSLGRLGNALSFTFLEYARTWDQYIDDWLLTSIELSEGIGEEAVRVAQHFGKSEEHLKWLDQFSIDLKAPIDLPAYSRDAPLSRVKSLEQYDGDFPTPVLAHRDRWNLCCEIEARSVLDDHLYKKDPTHYAEGAAAWLEHVESSPWLRQDTDKPDIFRHYVNKGDWARAWLSLNAHGWKLSQVSDALHELDRRTRAPGFDLTVAAWHEMLKGWTGRDYY